MAEDMKSFLKTNINIISALNKMILNRLTISSVS